MSYSDVEGFVGFYRVSIPNYSSIPISHCMSLRDARGSLL